jgi:DNA-binding PadR family transcriptional regulator
MNDLELAKIARLVFFVRGEKVMLDADLARLYGVTTGNLNKAVKRNQRRFPGDFIFQLTEKETENLIFHSGRSKGRGGRRHRPYAFTEQGVAMLSSVLNSERAVQVNIAIMRTFVQLRRLMDSNADLARKIESLEKKYDEKFAAVFAAIKQLIAPTEPAKKRIGFHP